MEFNIDPKDLNLQDAAGMQLVEVIRNLADESGTADYEDLENLPQINGVKLVGNKSSDDLHIAVSDEQVVAAVDAWLDDNVAQETGYVLDDSLTLSNAAAPADLVGDIKNNLGESSVVWEDGGFIQTNITTAVNTETPSEDASWRCSVVECQAGDVFTIFATSDNVAPRAWAFLDSEKKVICCEGAKISCVGKVIKAPAGSAYLVINDKSKEKTCYYGMIASKRMEIGIKAASDIGTVVDWNACNNEDAFIRENQFINAGTPSNQSQSDYFCVDNIPCKPYTKYAVYSDSTTTTARFVCFYDKDHTYLSQVQNVATFTTPADAKYMAVSFHYKVSGVDGNQTKGNYYCRLDYNKNKRDNIVINTALSGSGIDSVHNDNNIRMACINFQFDDGNANDDDIVEIFDSYGFKCGFSLPSNLNAETMARYATYQENGYEIISHSTDSTGMNDPSVESSTIETKLKTAKETLESYGFVVKGFVTPSGAMADKFKPLLRKYYQWAVTKYFGGYSGTGTPYGKPENGVFNLFRISLEETTLDNQKAAVDAVISGGGCLTFYSHSLYLDNDSYNLTTDNLNALLAYIQGKVASGDCIVGKPSEIIWKYYNVRNDDVANGWIDIPSSSVSLHENIDVPLAWYVSYNPYIKLLSFDVRLRPKTNSTGQFTLCTLPVNPSFVTAIVENELGLDVRFDNKNIVVYSNWNAMIMNRFHIVCRIP